MFCEKNKQDAYFLTVFIRNELVLTYIEIVGVNRCLILIETFPD